MSSIKLVSDTLAVTPTSGEIEYNGQLFVTDSNASRAQIVRCVRETAVTASSTSVDFTGIPSWVKRITVMFTGVSTSGSSKLVIRLGDSGGFETTGYASSVARVSTATSETSGFGIVESTLAATIWDGMAIISNLTGNTWTEFGSFANGSNCHSSGGSKTLSATLDRIRITTVNGTDTFDAGTINIMYEG